MNHSEKDRNSTSSFQVSDALWRVLPLVPLIVVLFAFVVRVYGVSWDGGALYHPDERSILMRAEQMHRTLSSEVGWQFSANTDFPLDKSGLPGISTLLNADRSPLNPHWFPLGSIIIYLLVGVRYFLDLFMDQVKIQDLAIAGRVLTSLVSTVSIFILYLLGKRVFGLSVGLLAAVLLTFSAIDIQISNFYRPEPFVAALSLACFWFMLNIISRSHWRDHILLGLFLGLSFSFRSTSLPLIIPVAMTYFFAAAKQKRDGLAWFTSNGKPPLVVLGVVAALTSFFTFAMLQPYALLDFGQFVSDQTFEGRIARTAGLVPYTIQYVGAQTGIYEIRQSSIWGLGLPLGVSVWVGLLLSLGRISLIQRFGSARLGEILFIAWVVPFLITLALFEVKFIRYLIPIMPVLVLLGSRWMIAAIRFSHAVSIKFSRAVIFMVIVVIGSTVFFGMSFTATFDEPHPAMSASEWINENLEPGSFLLLDNHWDEGFKDLGGFKVSQLRIYESDTVDKLTEITKQASQADYIIAYSNRPSASISRVPGRYP